MLGVQAVKLSLCGGEIFKQGFLRRSQITQQDMFFCDDFVQRSLLLGGIVTGFFPSDSCTINLPTRLAYM